MPRYFLSYEGSSTLLDEQGFELHDDEAARCAASDLAASLLKDRTGGFADRPRWRVTVQTESGQVIFAIVVAGEALSRSRAANPPSN